MALLIRALAGGWLLEGALMSVFVRRLRIYCMMLVDGFCGAAVMAVIDGGGPVVFIGGWCWAVQGGVMEIVVGG